MSKVAVSSRKGLFVIGPDDTVAGAHFLGDTCNLFAEDPRDGTWLAALDLGHFGTKLRRSRDRGANWEDVAVPTYPEVPADEPPTPDGKPADWSLKSIWALTPGSADQPGRWWCGTIPGGLFVSDDAGDSWQLVDALWRHPTRRTWFGGGADYPGIHSVLVDPRDHDHLRLAVSCAGVWRSGDAGASWDSIGQGLRAEFMPPEQQGDPLVQDPHLMVASPVDPDRLWIQHHNGIFRSDDGGANWTEIEGVEPSAFGFCVAAHPTRRDTAWFVPAVKDESRYAPGGALVVTRTDDGGASFSQQRAGLPQANAYDLVYRHALCVDASGDALSFGSTTGNLFRTDDGGGTWRCAHHHLPPIYAVTALA